MRGEGTSRAGATGRRRQQRQHSSPSWTPSTPSSSNFTPLSDQARGTKRVSLNFFFNVDELDPFRRVLKTISYNDD